jgi:hypothetical protein
MDQRLCAIVGHLLSLRRAEQFDPKLVPPHLLRHIYILQVEGSGGFPTLHVRFSGTAIEQRFDRALKGALFASLGGKYHGPEIIDAFRECLEYRRPLWVRQTIRVTSVSTRHIEAIMHFLEPDRIYGALVTGEHIVGASDPIPEPVHFERATLA